MTLCVDFERIWLYVRTFERATVMICEVIWIGLHVFSHPEDLVPLMYDVTEIALVSINLNVDSIPREDSAGD